MSEKLRMIPSITKLVESQKGKELIDEYGRKDFLETSRLILNNIRENIDKKLDEDLAPEVVMKNIEGGLKGKTLKKLKRVINCTGTILHTNLGRAPLPNKVFERLTEVSSGYSNLEFDLTKGERGSRTAGISEQLATILGVEDCVIVNNNAAAVLLSLMALTPGKEVIISRGQLVEIGGSFRVPEIMEQSGSILREVGTTNKAHLQDYQNAINENTGAILRVHPSNYRVVGFTEEVELKKLSQLAKENGIPLIDDLGSGTLVNLIQWGIHDEPTVMESVESGADVVTFSGDKLLGGPQCGVIIGKGEYINKIKKHPLMRALRCDKLVLTALQETLEIYKNENLDQIPFYKFLNRSIDELSKMAQEITKDISKDKFEIVNDFAYVGGGSLPNHKLETVVIKIKNGASAQHLSEKLRDNKVPIIGRINQGEYILDLKAVFEKDIPVLQDALSKV